MSEPVAEAPDVTEKVGGHVARLGEPARGKKRSSEASACQKLHSLSLFTKLHSSIWSPCRFLLMPLSSPIESLLSPFAAAQVSSGSFGTVSPYLSTSGSSPAAPDGDRTEVTVSAPLYSAFVWPPAFVISFISLSHCRLSSVRSAHLTPAALFLELSLSRSRRQSFFFFFFRFFFVVTISHVTSVKPGLKIYWTRHLSEQLQEQDKQKQWTKSVHVQWLSLMLKTCSGS